MKKDVQNIRKSQFVLSYGPGSIIEGKNGSRLMPSIDTGMTWYMSKEFLEKNEISDIRMSNIVESFEDREIDSGVGLFSLPSNSSLNIKESTGIYNTFVFPIWKLCFSSKHKYPVLFDSSKSHNCPMCGENTDAHVSFVCACPSGHLDEVFWSKAVHNNKKTDCETDYFYWKVRGSTLSDIIIECPICHSRISLKEVYTMDFPCTCRNPEKENPIFNKNDKVFYSYPNRKFGLCHNKMRILQKQSTSLRISENISLLRIPKYEHPMFTLLSNTKINVTIKMYLKFSQDYGTFLNLIEEDIDIDDCHLTKTELNTFKNYIDNVGFDEFKDLFNKLDNNKLTFEDAILEEFNTLITGNYCGSLLCKGKSKKYNFSTLNGDFPIKITPIEKMKTVTTQIGFKRKPYIALGGENNDEELNRLNSSGFKISPQGKTWYPAYESVVEGIFITSDLNPISHLNLNQIAKKWIDNKPTHHDLSKRNNTKEPEFVWWHSFAHSLIKSLSIFSGYSSASLRERIYLKDGIGGILIYNTSPGDDCGMGGLVDLVSDFDPILENAKNILLNCSNDPICSYNEIRSDKVNGAACHNCLLISETSCEHANMWLDRHFFLGD